MLDNGDGFCFAAPKCLLRPLSRRRGLLATIRLKPHGALFCELEQLFKFP
jgi:hypothetical protein